MAEPPTFEPLSFESLMPEPEEPTMRDLERARSILMGDEVQWALDVVEAAVRAEPRDKLLRR